jgi:hypothetical protein
MDAGHYYTGDPDLPLGIPHEFGHLIGLEDEYERDAADYQRVTGEAPLAGSGDVATATTIATGIHDALFLGEHWYERHKTAERRRKDAVNRVLAAHHIVPAPGVNPLTRQVSIQYAAKYGHEMSQDFMAQVDTDNDEFNDWREQALGTFQLTSASMMGAESAYPLVEPRHVRGFARLIQQTLGRGKWQPEQDH